MQTNASISADNKLPVAIGPYRQSAAAGGLLFLSGQIPIDPATGALVAGGIEEQTAQVMKNISAILAASGLGLENVVKTTVLLADMSLFAAMNTVYGEAFKSAPPARSTFAVKELPRGALVEIECVAAAG
jgi:endoribonuclease L-PSP, putative